MANPLPPDTLNEIGVLKRREIEARILAPLVNAFAAEFGRERVVEIAERVIVQIARDQGRALANHGGKHARAPREEPGELAERRCPDD
jgi:hypothetical protein